MRTIHALAVLLSLTVAQSASADGGDGKRLQLKVINHQPRTAKPTASETIRFSAGSETSLREDKPRGDGYYYFDEPVVVHKLMRGNAHAYVEARYGNKAPLNMDEESWDKYAADGRILFMTVYLLNEPISGSPESQLRAIARDGSGKVIGCHKITVSVLAPNGK